MERERSIPATRASRLLHMGKIVGGIAGGAVTESLRQLRAGNLPTGPELLTTPANARRLVEQLSEMRGAAMKIGQLLSMEGGELLPREFSETLSRLRADAHAMPMLQVAAQLEEAWGKNWLDLFERFYFQPIAAASIGQVHKATDRNGRHLAIKIQYPGIRESIDSDVDNVATLLKFFRLLPEPDALLPVLNEARRQLHEEADYLAEAQHMEDYRSRVNRLTGFRVPRLLTELNRTNVLAMELIDGKPIDSIAGASRKLRNTIAKRLVNLFVKEVFEWGLVQTDGNFSNYLHIGETDDVGLIDFGATRSYSTETIMLFRQLLSASLHQDERALMEAAAAAGYVGRGDPVLYRSTVYSLLKSVAEPARTSGAYDFSTSTLARRMSEQVVQLRLESKLWRMPPAEILFLHRKLGGIYLLCTRLSASVDVGRLVEPYVSQPSELNFC